jgi:hypothetical protein
MKRYEPFGVACLGDVLAFPLCLPCHLWVMCGHAEALWRRQGGKEANEIK